MYLFFFRLTLLRCWSIAFLISNFLVAQGYGQGRKNSYKQSNLLNVKYVNGSYGENSTTKYKVRGSESTYPQ